MADIAPADARPTEAKTDITSSSCTDLVVFNLASPFSDKLSAQERIYDFDGKIIKVRQNWKPDGKGGSKIGFGCSVYDGCFVLLHYLRTHPYLLRNRAVLELGCGTGFVSIVASMLGAGLVLCTDGGEESVELSQINVDLNRETISSSTATAAATVCSFELGEMGRVSSEECTKTNINKYSSGGTNNINNDLIVRRLLWADKDDTAACWKLFSDFHQHRLQQLQQQQINDCDARMKCPDIIIASDVSSTVHILYVYLTCSYIALDLGIVYCMTDIIYN